MFVLSAAAIARWLGERPAWAKAQRWVLGCVFAGIAAKARARRAQMMLVRRPADQDAFCRGTALTLPR
jgi:hypothetical protein